MEGWFTPPQESPPFAEPLIETGFCLTSKAWHETLKVTPLWPSSGGGPYTIFDSRAKHRELTDAYHHPQHDSWQTHDLPRCGNRCRWYHWAGIAQPLAGAAPFQRRSFARPYQDGLHVPPGRLLAIMLLATSTSQRATPAGPRSKKTIGRPGPAPNVPYCRQASQTRHELRLLAGWPRRPNSPTD